MCSNKLSHVSFLPVFPPIQVTQRFSSEELVSWNLLTRTNNDFQYISLKLTLVYGLGIFVRYCILMPLRYTKLAS